VIDHLDAAALHPKKLSIRSLRGGSLQIEFQSELNGDFWGKSSLISQRNDSDTLACP